MYYFYDNEKTIIKQEITFYKDEVKKLRNEVIKNCSVITHEEYDSDYDPMIDDCFIRSYQKKFIGQHETYEGYRNFYHYSYNLLTPPYLVRLIDRLLIDDPTVIYEIDHYDYTKEASIDNKINEKKEMCNKISDGDYDKKISILKELEKLAYDKKLNNKQVPTRDYYYKLLSYIQKKNVFELDKNYLNNVRNFLDLDIEIKDGIILSTPKNTKQYKKIK